MEKDWNFDEIIDRRNTASVKWEPEILRARFGSGREDLLPLWVADMDFNSPTVVRKAMEDRIAHQIYGYSIIDPDYDNALISWYQRNHKWDIKKEWILTSPGIVPATNYLIQRFSSPGDKILIQTPVYYPFAAAIIRNGRIILENPLKIDNGRYQMDFDDLEKRVKDPRVKIAILCSPHNPVGRVWSREELEQFGRICIANNVLIFSDEIHCDLVMPGVKHTCFQSISPEFADHSIAAHAASKTFNLAGFNHSSIIIPNANLRNEYAIFCETLGVSPRSGGSILGSITARAAYNGAQEWLDDLILYLHGNFIYLKTTFKEQLPRVNVFELEGTYLAWVDFRPLGFTPDQLVNRLEEKAGVALDHGDWFADWSGGFERINIACPRSILKKAVNQILAALKA